VNREERIKEYALKAKEAEEQAAKTQDQSQRNSWLKIADSYRRLAREN
jgi:hypothetical protein